MFGGLDLNTPEALWEELDRNRAFLLKKSGATEEAFDRLLEIMRDRIASVPLETIAPHLAVALQKLGEKDRLDAPYVATAIAIAGSVWTQDRRLSRKAGVKCYTTKELAGRL